MTAITPLRGTQVYIKVEDDASPATYAHPCLINTKRGVKFTSSTNKVIVPSCDSPDDPAWSDAIKDALSASIDGAGTLDNKAATISFYDAWYRSPDPKSVKIYLGSVGHWLGDFQLTGWEINGDRNANAEVSITLESDGPLSAFVVGS